MPRNHDEIHDSDYELDEEDSAHDYDEGEDEEESSEDDYDCEDPCQQVLDAGILRRFKEILRNKGKNRLKMGACDVIAELAMGNQTQIRALITEEIKLGSKLTESSHNKKSYVNSVHIAIKETIKPCPNPSLIDS
ncbi:uncharacterized protein LOC130710084 isoform X2 [Lotus japonicus]|uniref:uncharacterized protein LOC130710084 isoform X2 n=1 Tax=Lotus japonicus TaxID=34305 RepID=UPI00258C3650|nr:uncharacterized protein LOC130710084 isoform X2 [Lotus japonicus]